METAKRGDGRPTGYVEEGEAFADLVGLDGRSKARGGGGRRRYDVIVIGGGQSGLAVGYHLKRRGLRFVILDAAERTGDAWRNRWDSLRLFTPAWLSGLPGMPFPAAAYDFPTKDEMADYLEGYVRHFELPVRTGTRVTRLGRRDGRFVVTASGTADADAAGDGGPRDDRGPSFELEADQVVVAMASYQKRRVPDFASELDDGIVQLHSSEYRSPSDLKPGAVLIVGAGNSGAEIAKELAGRHHVFVSGRDVGQLPFRIGGLFGRLLLTRLVARVIFHRLLTIRTRLGRKLYPKLTTGSGPLIRVKRRDLAALGVERVPRTTGASEGWPELADGRVLDVANVIWCTGYHPGMSWIDLPVIGPNGKPRHDGGVVPEVPGLYFVGLHFLYALSSGMIHGMGRDAERIVNTVAERAAADRPRSWADARTSVAPG